MALQACNLAFHPMGNLMVVMPQGSGPEGLPLALLKVTCVNGYLPSRVCLPLQYLLQSCSRGGKGIVEDMCYERRRAEACVD